MSSIDKIRASGPLSWVRQCLFGARFGPLPRMATPQIKSGFSRSPETPESYFSASIVTLSRVAIVGLIAASGLLAQQELPYRITTVAGSGAFRFRDNGQQAAQARLVDPQGVARDDAGNVYFSDGFFNIVLRVSPAGTISRLAGTGDQGLAGDEGPALDALFNQPRGVALDASENLYVVDRLNGRIRRIDSSGVITTIAGGGSGNNPGNGGSAIKAVLFEPQDIVIDREKNILYFSGSSGFLVDVRPTPAPSCSFCGTGIDHCAL